jgi:hypothetical protein
MFCIFHNLASDVSILNAMGVMMSDTVKDRLKSLFDSQLRTRRNIMKAGGSAFLATGAMLSMGSARAQVLTGTGDQPDWRFCDRCFSMFYNKQNPNNGYAGRCPSASGVHHAQGFLFTVHFDSSRRQPVAGRDSQFDWRFCSKCFCMHWEPSKLGLRCAGGGTHAAFGFIFGLPHDNPGNPGQADWRYCQKCGTLFFDNPNSPDKGSCPGNGNAGHSRSANSFNFQIPFTTTSAAPVPVQQSTSPYANKILQYAQAEIGKKLGRGECTDLVVAALAFAGARPGDTSSPIGAYIWGRKINFPTESVQPGDIIQLVNVKLSFNSGGSSGYWETTTQHSAIIETASGLLLHVIGQNAPPGTPVSRQDINLNWHLDRGSYAIYRAQ